MSGRGTYIFPDGSSLSALWSHNKPLLDVVYTEPLGHEWTTELISDNVGVYKHINLYIYIYIYIFIYIYSFIKNVCIIYI